MMISKGLRFLEKVSSGGSNEWRKFFLRLKYPGLKIDRKTVLGRNCKIVCVDGGKLEIINSSISEGVLLFADSEAKLLIDHVNIGRYTTIASKMAITIHYKTMIAEMVVIRDMDHVVSSDLSEAELNNYNVSPIIIGKHAWIASKATILKGVTIGDYSIIAASAVVTKPVPPGELWAGIPAKFLKKASIGH